MNRHNTSFFNTLLVLLSVANASSPDIADGRDVMFGIGTKLDDHGEYPSIAVNDDGVLIVVHKDPSTKNTLYYRLGRIADFLTIDFATPSKLVIDEDGKNADIAINNRNQLVVAYISSKSMLTYRIGTIDNRAASVRWSAANAYTSAISVSVSLNDEGTTVFLFDRGGSLKKKSIFSVVGRINGDMLNFSTEAVAPLDSGQSPQVAINNLGDIVEVHRAGSSASNSLFYTIGKFDRKASSINWSTSVPYDSGYKPSIALNNDRLLCEAHQSSDDNVVGSHLSSRIGALQQDVGHAALASLRVFDTGVQVSTSCNRRYAVQVHKSASTLFKGLFYTVSSIIDRSRWMEKLAPKILSRPLWKITLPATHDSGAVNLTQTTKNSKASAIGFASRLQAKAQSEDFYGQLRGGIRCFDLRPAWKSGKIYTYHFNLGPEVSTFMSQVAKFLSEVSKELVLLRVNHFGSFDDKSGSSRDAKHRQLVDLIVNALRPYLLIDSANLSSVELIGTPIGRFLRNGPRVIVFYNDSYIDRYPQAGFWHQMPVFDRYSNTDSLQRLKDDQAQKYEKNFGTPDHLFLLSYTLTLQPPFIPTKPTLHQLTKPAGASLAQFLKERANANKPINIILVDFYADSRVTDLAVMLNNN